MSTESDAKIAQNNADIAAAYKQLWEMQQQEMEKQRAQSEGEMFSQLALHEAGKAADNAFMFLTQWQQTVNARSEAEAQGIPPPQHMDSELLFQDGGSNNDSRWQVLGNIFNAGNNGNNDPNGGNTPTGP